MVGDRTDWGGLADTNLALSWLHMGRSTGAAVDTSVERCVFVASGIPIAFFNGAFVTGPVDDPGRVIADAIAFMTGHGVPWLLWVRDGVDDALLEAGRRAGLTAAGGPPGMVLPQIPEAPAPPPELSITTVADRADMARFRDVMARGYEMPVDVVNVLFGDGMFDNPAMTLVLGVVDGEPVSGASVSVTGSTAGIYNVGTPPEHRRRGYGAALTWAAIRSGVEQGCDHAALQASELGAPIYRSMGFVDVGNYVQLQGAAPAG